MRNRPKFNVAHKTDHNLQNNKLLIIKMFKNLKILIMINDNKTIPY